MTATPSAVLEISEEIRQAAREAYKRAGGIKYLDDGWLIAAIAAAYPLIAAQVRAGAVEELEQKAQRVRNLSAPDQIFEAVPVGVIRDMGEASSPLLPAPPGRSEMTRYGSWEKYIGAATTAQLWRRAVYFQYASGLLQVGWEYA